MSDHHDSARRHFQALQQTDFLRLEHAAYLKGLLKPFKGKGALEDWANQCFALRDDMIGLAQRRVWPRRAANPFTRWDVNLANQNTAAATTFLRCGSKNRPPMDWWLGRARTIGDDNV